jgi:hypothetical protein
MSKTAPQKPTQPTQAELLIDIASMAVLFHSPDGRGFAEIPVDSHVENHEIKSTGFRRWLVSRFFADYAKPPSAEAMQQVLGVLEATAFFDGPEELIYIRVAPGNAGSIYLDLCDSVWRVVHIERTGWSIVDRPPVRFIRPKGMRPLPAPQSGGMLEPLWILTNIEADDRPLVLAWLTAAMLPTGPYPVLKLGGEQGSAKSTLAELLRGLIDPHECMLRAEPRENRDLMIAATNSWVACYDNLSRLPNWLSDGLCRLSTGGGFATRTLYENSEETFLAAKRPVLLAGVEDVVNRGDLADRCIHVTLSPIPEDKRRTERSLLGDYELAAPLILGAILGIVSRALSVLPAITLERLPRMADFAVWGEAVCRAAGGKEGEFLAVYSGNRKHANEAILDDSPVPTALKKLMIMSHKWEGAASELLDALALAVDDKTRQSTRWPKSPRAMAGAIRRLSPSLRVVGIEVEFSRDPHSRKISIKWTAPDKGRNFASFASSSSSPSVSSHETHDANHDAKSPPTVLRHGSVMRKSSVSSRDDGHDANDAKSRSFSADGQREEIEI